MLPSEEPISQELNNINGETETSDSFLPSPSSQLQGGLPDSALSGATVGDASMVNKLNHNASERDRRKKINSLFSSLRSLLPAADQMKILSIPATVSHMLKYIPELQKELEKLVQKKEELVSRTSRQEELVIKSGNKRKVTIKNSLSAVSVSLVGNTNREVLIQMSSVGVNEGPSLSEALIKLEEDGLLLLNASTFQSFGERVVYNLHLLGIILTHAFFLYHMGNMYIADYCKDKFVEVALIVDLSLGRLICREVQGTQNIEIEMLREKLLSLYEKEI